MLNPLQTSGQTKILSAISIIFCIGTFAIGHRILPAYFLAFSALMFAQSLQFKLEELAVIPK